jgi:hypothetical protein
MRALSSSVPRSVWVHNFIFSARLNQLNTSCSKNPPEVLRQIDAPECFERGFASSLAQLNQLSASSSEEFQKKSPEALRQMAAAETCFKRDLILTCAHLLLMRCRSYPR